MELKFISYLPAIVGVLSIGVFVLLNNPKNINNRIFALLNFSMTVWLSSLFIADTTVSESVALWSLRSALFFGQLMFLFFYYFALVFPSLSKIKRSKVIFYSLPIIILAILLLTPLGVESVSIQKSGVQPEEFGILYTLSDLIGVAYLVFSSIIILRKYKKSDSSQRSQIKFILFGLSVALFVNIITGFILTLLNVSSEYLWFGPFSIFIFSLFMAYAIVKHRFFDVRAIVARSFAYLATLLLVAAIYSVILFGIINTFIDSNQVSTTHQLIYIIPAVLLSFSFPEIKKFIDKQSKTLFYRDAYDSQEFINEFNRTIVSTIDLEKLLNRSSTIINEYIKPEYCAFLIRDEAGGKFRIIGAAGNTVIHKEVENIRELVRNHDQKVFNTNLLESDDNHLSKTLLSIRAGLLARVTTNAADEGLGYIILGYKKSGNIYDTQDSNVVETIANELAIAIQNALQFEEIQAFNVTLQQKIQDATHRLRQTNEKLKTLDQTKDEFISMASHQLRTPLTSVKGYLSMVLEGDVGKLNNKQYQMLDQAFISSQRMVYLIADLLNVSRLHTGKFVIETIPTNLADVVEGEVSQLVETAKSRNLELVYKKPAKFTSIMLDETKIRQVVMNFIDNAIYYTPAGGQITISVTESPQAIEFKVEDNGIGIPKTEQHHLFTKFFRAGNARKARPDGTGLGLFMAKKVVVAQGGSILFSSQEGKGSMFGFSFAKEKLAVPEITPTKD